MNKRLSEVEVTSHAQIIDEWYRLMEQNNVSVQPKASTILGTILAKYDISTKQQPRDIWKEALSLNGSELSTWYTTLTDVEKRQYEEGRLRANEAHDPRYKSLLKG